MINLITLCLFDCVNGKQEFPEWFCEAFFALKRGTTGAASPTTESKDSWVSC